MQVRREWLVLKPVINISPIHPASHTPSSASSLAQHRLIFIALKWWRYLKWSQGSQSNHLSTHTAKLFSSLANCRWTQQQSRSYYSFQGFSCVCGSGPSVYFEGDLSTTINCSWRAYCFQCCHQSGVVSSRALWSRAAAQSSRTSAFPCLTGWRGIVLWSATLPVPV